MLDLIAAVAAGDRRALSALYERTANRLLATASSLLQCDEDGQEVVWDVYLYVWKHAASYDRQRGSVVAWLDIITRHRAIDVLRRRRPMTSLDEGEHTDLVESLLGEVCGSDELLMQSQSEHTLSEAMVSLTPLRRDLISLSFFGGLSHQEIADAMTLPLGSVKSHIRRALANLKSALQGKEA